MLDGDIKLGLSLLSREVERNTRPHLCTGCSDGDWASLLVRVNVPRHPRWTR